MGIMDFMNSTTDYLKRNAPDPAPVKDACWTAVNGVRDNVVEGVNKYYPDNETQAKIGRIATKIGNNTADYALQEGLKCIPGRNAFDKIVWPAFRDEMAPQAKILELEGAMDKEFASENAPRLDLSANQKPEDVIRMFMMNGVMGGNIFDALMVPLTSRAKNQK